MSGYPRVSERLDRSSDRKSTRLNSSHVSISYFYTLSLHDALPILELFDAAAERPNLVANWPVVIQLELLRTTWLSRNMREWPISPLVGLSCVRPSLHVRLP